ncbi:hypothetical protein EGK70_016175 [Alcaligenes aquatilis]|uniref:hypothetical protein n=1 Tax=Alcaligenes aquatilis TaxID=323284 RepID=UPI000F672926|nr:hypothetical protein [Alcaligenes aquatilis]QXR35343.1 hypothetical protein EGK70_016175 [Alcaligenes aquatilis]
MRKILITLAILFTYPAIAERTPTTEEMRGILERLDVKREETAEKYEIRTRKIMKELDPSTTHTTLCDLISERADCDLQMAESTIQQYLYVQDQSTNEKVCENIGAAVSEIQTIRQNGKPLHLFKLDASDRNYYGSYSWHLILYTFRHKLDVDARLLGADIELYCMKNYETLITLSPPSISGPRSRYPSWTY